MRLTLEIQTLNFQGLKFLDFSMVYVLKFIRIFYASKKSATVL